MADRSFGGNPARRMRDYLIDRGPISPEADHNLAAMERHLDEPIQPYERMVTRQWPGARPTSILDRITAAIRGAIEGWRSA